MADMVVFKKLQDIEKLNEKENPFNTEVGQTVVSTSENFWARLHREGRPRQMGDIQTPCSNVGNYTYFSIISPSPACVFYPKRAVMSFNQDAELIAWITSGIDKDDNQYFSAYCKAGTPYILDFDGEVKIYEGGYIKIGVCPTASGKFYGSISGVEVSINA